MLRIPILGLTLVACATGPKTVNRDVRGCVYVGLIESGPRADIVSETESMGPMRIIWYHPPEGGGYLVESNRAVYRCPTPRPQQQPNKDAAAQAQIDAVKSRG